MNIKIITDSACDIPLKAKLKHVDILNFYLTIDGKSFEERKDFTFKEFYKILEKCEAIPSTAHITMLRYGEKFESVYHNGASDIIVVTINKGASATYDAAVMARQLFFEEHPDAQVNITIVDSACYSVGYGWPIMQADEMIEKGATPQEIIAYFNAKFQRTEILLAAYTLKFMKKSGRISAAAAFAGEMLSFKPIITMIKGHTTVVKKVRGDKMVIPGLIQQFKERTDDLEHYIIGYTDEEYGKELYSECVKEIGFPPLGTFELGCAVTINAGNHSLGIVYTGK
ncbi:MAG: DegV family protein [Oscillospiraceae bacterium]